MPPKTGSHTYTCVASRQKISFESSFLFKVESCIALTCLPSQVKHLTFVSQSLVGWGFRHVKHRRCFSASITLSEWSSFLNLAHLYMVCFTSSSSGCKGQRNACFSRCLPSLLVLGDVSEVAVGCLELELTEVFMILVVDFTARPNLSGLPRDTIP